VRDQRRFPVYARRAIVGVLHIAHIIHSMPKQVSLTLPKSSINLSFFAALFARLVTFSTANRAHLVTLADTVSSGQMRQCFSQT
jgi:hypothetical protein